MDEEQNIQTAETSDSKQPEVTPLVQEPIQGKKKNKWLIISLSIFALSALGIMGFLVYQNLQQKNLNIKSTPARDKESSTKDTQTGMVYSNPCDTGDKKGCIMENAYSRLRKSSESIDYTIVWDEAFQVCEENPDDQSILFRIEECKKNVCNNLHLVDGNIKYNYPESEACWKEANKNSTCSDNKKNGSETDIDCGGPDCDSCNIDKICKNNTDCKSGVCNLNGVEYRFRCLKICPDGPIKTNAPCGCKPSDYEIQGQEKSLIESWEEEYGNGKTLFCCRGILQQLFPNQNCPL